MPGIKTFRQAINPNLDASTLAIMGLRNFYSYLNNIRDKAKQPFLK